MAARYEAFINSRLATQDVVGKAVKTAIVHFGELRLGETLKLSLSLIREWAQSEENKTMAELKQLWTDIAEIHAIDMTPPVLPLTVYNGGTERPRIYYEYVVREILQIDNINPLVSGEAMVV